MYIHRLVSVYAKLQYNYVMYKKCSGCSLFVGFKVQGSSEGVVLQRVREEEEREWLRRHWPSSTSWADTDTCGTMTSALNGNSCKYTYVQEFYTVHFMELLHVVMYILGVV